MVDQKFAVAVHLMTALAHNKGELTNSALLASSTSSHPVVVRKLLIELRQAGLVLSTKGKQGGVMLAKPAVKINLRDIFLAVQNKRIVACSNKPTQKSCPISRCMKSIMEEILDGAEQSYLNHLKGIPLSDLQKRVK